MNPLQWLSLGVLVIAGFFHGSQAHAGVGRDRATGQAIWDAAVNGRSTTIGGSNGSMRVIGPAGGAASGASPGSAAISGSGTVPVADKKAPLNLSGEVAKDAVVGGVVGCLTGGAVGCVLGVATPLALAYVANSGVRKNPDTGALEKTDPGACLIAPCFGYRMPDPYGSANPTIFRSKQSMYEAFKAAYNADNFYWQVSSCQDLSEDEFRCSRAGPGGADANQFNLPLAKVSREPDSATWYPATPQEVRDALYNNNPPPGIVDELARYGNIIWPLSSPSVTGPAEITGPKTTTTNPDGSKSVSQERTPLSYSGPTVTAGPTTKTTETFAPDGTPTGTTTETTEPGTEAESSPGEAAPTDTPLGPIPTLYTPKFPDGMTGVWNVRKADLMSSPLMQLKDQLLPTVGEGGACPAWQLPVNVAWVDFGTYNVAPPCWIWDFGKVVIVLSAMFLARALIFGG